MAAFEVPRFWICGIITHKDLLFLTVKEGTVEQNMSRGAFATQRVGPLEHLGRL